MNNMVIKEIVETMISSGLVQGSSLLGSLSR